jgi:hypothetical protein
MRRLIVIGCLALLIAAVPVGLTAFRLSEPANGATAKLSHHVSGPSRPTIPRKDPTGQRHTPVVKGATPHVSAAKRALDNAVAQTDSVSSYQWVASAEQSGTGSNVQITSSGSADLDPLAVEEITTGSPYGNVAIRFDDMNVWYELDAPDSIPPATASVWTGPVPLSAFMDEAGSAVGEQLKALMSLGTGSPGGEINITQQAIAGATPVGAVTVDGQQVEEYDVSIATRGFLDEPNVTAQERQTLSTAVQQLNDLPLKATVDVSPAGYIVQDEYTVTFANGSSVSSQKTFSDFDQTVSISMPVTPPPSPGSEPILPAGPMSTGPASVSPPPTCCTSSTSTSRGTRLK